MLVVPLVFVILGVVNLVLGPNARLLIPVQPDPSRLTIVQWLFLGVLAVIILGCLFGIGPLMEEFGWTVRRLP